MFGPRGTSPAGAPVRFWSRKSVSTIGIVVACTMPVPAWCGTGARGRSGRCDCASIAAATSFAVLASAPVAFLASRTRIARSLTSTLSGRSLPGRLTNSTVIPLPPSWPHAAELTTTAAFWLVAPVVEPIVACALRW